MHEGPVYAVYFRPADFAGRSGLEPLVEVMGARPIKHGCFWRAWGGFHWRMENLLRTWGQRYYGSEWNYLAPIWDEWRIARRVREPNALVHFLFAEFAGVRKAGSFRARHIRLAATFHTSPRRQDRVCGHMRLEVYDAISVVASGQRAWFESRGYPSHRILLTLHGVDTGYFRPDPDRSPTPEDRPLRGLLVGATERDHEMAAQVMRALPHGVMTLDVATKPYPHPAYQDVPNVRLLSHQDDAALLRAYQSADLLMMPLLDATANNAILEAMACGTPVVTNRTCGTADYVDPSGGWVVEPHTRDAWVETLRRIASERDVLLAKRVQARAWAERLDWNNLLPQYRALYRAARAP